MALGATPTQEPALGDLDGDGFDDIVCAAITSLARVDSAGVMAASANWPLALGAAAGTPVIGPLRAGGLPAVMLARSNALSAFDDLAQPLFAFPEPGGAAGPATLAELDGDGRTEVVAGTGPDSLLYIYDARATTWSATGSLADDAATSHAPAAGPTRSRCRLCSTTFRPRRS